MSAEPRASSSLCLVRNGAAGIEVLMAQRNHQARFMPGAWVFPGGVVDDADWSAQAAAALDGLHDDAQQGWLAAALRETVEETGIWLSASPFVVEPDDRIDGAEVYDRAIQGGLRFHATDLVYFANWITPADLPIRFDTRFYLASTDASLDARADQREMMAAGWVAVGEAKARSDAGDLVLPFPTLKTVEWFATFGRAEDLMVWAQSLDRVPVTQPRIRISGSELEIVLPWDAGYHELPEESGNPELLRLAATARTVDGTPVAEMRPARDEVR